MRPLASTLPQPARRPAARVRRESSAPEAAAARSDGAGWGARLRAWLDRQAESRHHHLGSWTALR